MNPWSHLHNAEHIDRILDLIRERPEVWYNAWTSLSSGSQDVGGAVALAQTLGRAEAYETASADAWYMAREVALDSAWESFKKTLWEVDSKSDVEDVLNQADALSLAWNAAWFAILALIAYDESGEYIQMPSKELKTWAVLVPRLALLLPAAAAFEKINTVDNHITPC